MAPKTSSEVELMETRGYPKVRLPLKPKTSSEVELMETTGVATRVPWSVRPKTSSEVELMETSLLWRRAIEPLPQNFFGS